MVAASPCINSRGKLVFVVGIRGKLSVDSKILLLSGLVLVFGWLSFSTASSKSGECVVMMAVRIPSG